MAWVCRRELWPSGVGYRASAKSPILSPILFFVNLCLFLLASVALLAFFSVIKNLSLNSVVPFVLSSWNRIVHCSLVACTVDMFALDAAATRDALIYAIGVPNEHCCSSLQITIA